MASVDVVKLLGPGPGLDSSLNQFVDNYGPVVTSFDKLLRFPFLEDLKVTSDENEDPTSPNFREIIQDGKLKFDYFAGQEVSLARNLSSFGKMPPILLAKKSPSE